MGAVTLSDLADLGAVDWKVAAPYVAAAVALGVGLGSAVRSARNTNRTLAHARKLASEDRDHERTLAHDARIWERRAEVYVELLTWSEDSRRATEGAPARGQVAGLSEGSQRSGGD